MPDPGFHWSPTDPIHLTFTAPPGFQLDDLTHFSLIDQAQLTLPSSWSPLQARATVSMLHLHWEQNAHTMLDATLNAGATFTLANGTPGSIRMYDIWENIRYRPTKNLSLSLDIKLDGTTSRDAPHPIQFNAVLGLKAEF